MQKPLQKSGQIIRASTLASFEQRLRSLEQPAGWGSGQFTGGSVSTVGVKWFKASEDFSAFEDVYRGGCKEWWYVPTNNEFSVHNDDITVYSHADDVASGDVFSASFNHQSGRWEKISGGGCACQEIWCFLPLAPSAGTWDMNLTVNGTQETLTFDWNETQGGLSAELATHTELTGSDFELAGGPFPSVALYITWLLADDDILDTFPTIDTSSLTGDVTMFKFSLGRGL